MTDEQIKELFGVVPYFADTVIAPLSCESMKDQFRASLTWSFNGSINIQRVVGTMHADYAGLTWRELLKKGRRMYNNIKLYKQKPEYYTTFHESRTPSMSFFFYDGKGYVTEYGNHRTCIARFFLYPQKVNFFHGVHVHEQYTDLRMLGLFNQLQKILPTYCSITPCSQEVARDDGDGWATHYYENTICIENNRRRGVKKSFSADELEEELLPALLNPFKRRFGSYRNLLN